MSQVTMTLVVCAITAFVWGAIVGKIAELAINHMM